MSKFKFEYLFDSNTVSPLQVTVETETDDLEDVVQTVRQYLLACGFHYTSVEGSLPEQDILYDEVRAFLLASGFSKVDIDNVLEDE